MFPLWNTISQADMMKVVALKRSESLFISHVIKKKIEQVCHEQIFKFKSVY